MMKKNLFRSLLEKIIGTENKIVFRGIVRNIFYSPLDIPQLSVIILETPYDSFSEIRIPFYAVIGDEYLKRAVDIIIRERKGFLFSRIKQEIYSSDDEKVVILPLYCVNEIKSKCSKRLRGYIKRFEEFLHN